MGREGKQCLPGELLFLPAPLLHKWKNKTLRRHESDTKSCLCPAHLNQLRFSLESTKNDHINVEKVELELLE